MLNMTFKSRNRQLTVQQDKGFDKGFDKVCFSTCNANFSNQTAYINENTEGNLLENALEVIKTLIKK